MRNQNRRAVLLGVFFIASTLIPLTIFAQESTRKLEGLDVNAPSVYALTGATVHVDSSTAIENATIVVVREKIVAVGVDVEVPQGAQTVDLAGKHIYPGFVDPHIPFSVEWASVTGTAYWNENIRPQLKVSDLFDFDEIDHKDLRKAGITAGLFVPDAGIVRGQSSVLLTAPVDRELAILKKDFAQHLRLTVDRSFGRGYPNSPMGAVALARQTMYDASWYEKAHGIAAADSTVDRPETNVALEALQPVIKQQQVIFAETSNEIFALRADRFAREFGLKLAIVGSGEEYRHLDEIVDLGREMILPVNFPKPPVVSSPESARDVSLETLMHWDHAPENPARLSNKGVTFSFTSTGLKKTTDYLGRVRIAIKRGLSPVTALDALTITPARLLKLENQIGTISQGKLANFVVCDKPLFEEKSKIVETWVAGQQFEADKKPLRELDGEWNLKLKNASGMKNLHLVVDVKSGKLSAKFEVKEAKPKKATGKTSSEKKKKKSKKTDTNKDNNSESVKLNDANLIGTRLTGSFNSSSFGKDGVSQLSIVFNNDGSGIGQVVSPSGTIYSATAKRTEKKTDKLAEADVETNEKDESDEEGKDKPAKEKSEAATYAVNYPLGAFGRESIPDQPETVLIKNVTIWTCTDQGKIEGSVLFGGGLIKGIYTGKDKLPEAEVVFDGTGKHLTPGIIDCHSHSASDSGINESGQAVTAEVRIGDFIDADAMNIYRQLAGGVTTINILHGSSNPIGGQNAVVKLRWGALDEAMKFENAPQGIKFALGENVKRSRDPSATRYPLTRMGVVEIIENGFRAAEEYRAKQKAWEKNRVGLPPRKDLELEALAEIVEGTRWIHCHSYRQDEILALIRTLDKHKIKIGTFQHILEGYKVANEMAEHGAMASAFADWWAYKYEVKDAIPYAGALMHRAGVNVSFNSDDSELARHLNHEAAKAVRYGGVSEEEALKFVTLNPAMQLRIDDKVGSIETGKHADLVLWSGKPLSTLSRCEQTWVDGRKYFDIEEDLAARRLVKQQRVALIQKVLSSGQKMETKDRSKTDSAKLWPRYDEHCGMYGHHFEDRQFNGVHRGHSHQSNGVWEDALRDKLESDQPKE